MQTVGQPSLEEPIAPQIKRLSLDFVARDYTSDKASVHIVAGVPESARKSSAELTPWHENKAFTLRCYMSLQGDDSPITLNTLLSAEPPAVDKPQSIYRYDWAFGITLIRGFYWDWMSELPEESALHLHVLLQSDPPADGPEAIPIAAILSTLHPSRNTKSLWEEALPLLPKAAAEMTRAGAPALPMLNYLSAGLTLGSNVLASHTDNRKNWFLYQFLDDDGKCPVVEWRINKKVLVEYGPLIRGTLFLVFHNSAESPAGRIRISLRPQIRYHVTDELWCLVPTNEINQDYRIFIDVHPIAAEQPKG